LGFAKGNLTFVPNQFFSVPNNGEFEVLGSQFERNLAGSPDNAVVLGPLGYGIAVADNAVGTGFMMYSDESVFTRFAANPPYASNSEHVVAVKYQGGQWFYNNNSAWHAFTPVGGDLLLAAVDFSNDTVSSFAGVSGQVQGVEAGYAHGDVAFSADKFAGVFNAGEFEASGFYFARNAAGSPQQVAGIGPLNHGIAVADNAVGTGFLMYSGESLFSRFAGNPPYVTNSAHLIAVQNQSGQWYYNDNNTWHAFAPVATDLLVAEIDFTFDTIVSLQGQSGSAFGIAKGFAAADLSFFANQFAGLLNGGEFEAIGTYLIR
jgi:hypothetical protein